MSQLLALVLISLRVPLPLSLIFAAQHGSRHSPFISGPAICKRIHAITVGYSTCQMEAVTAEDALH